MDENKRIIEALAADQKKVLSKDEYWLPSARALGAQAVPLYHAELNRAVGAYDLGQLDQAELILDRLLSELEQALPTDVDENTTASFHLLYAEVLTARGRTYERRSDEKQARSAFRKAASEFAEWIGQAVEPSAQVYCHYGVALFKIGSKRRTIQAFELAQRMGTLNAEAYRYLGSCYCQTEDFQKAEDCFSAALKQEPGDFLTRKARAECLEKQGEIAEALTEYNHVALFMTTSGMFEAALTITDHMLILSPKDPDALVRAGEALLARGLYQQVLERLDEGLQQQPKNAAAVRIKGLALYALGKYEEAVRQFRRALKLDPSMNKARIKLASALNNLHDYEEALKVLEEALQQRPGESEALTEKANTLFAMARNQEALEVLDEVLKISPENHQALLTKGQVLTELKHYRRAVQALERSIKIDPLDPKAYAAMGQALVLSGENDRALESLEKALAIRPDYAPALAYKGETLRLLDRNEKALQALNQALVLTPFDAWVLGTKGQVLLKLGMYDEAVDALKECVKVSPSLMWAHGELITNLYRLGRLEETLTALDTALEVEMFVNWVVFKGQIYNEIAAFELAVKAADQAIKLDPKCAQAFGVKGWALENLRRGSSALETYELAEKIERKNLFWQTGIANSLYLMKDQERAAERYRSIVKEANGLIEKERNQDYLGLIAWSEYRLNNFARALKLFIEVLSADPNSIPNIFNFALILICMGRCDEALSEYKRGLTLVEGRPQLSRRGLISVALDDLDLALDAQESLSETSEQKELLSCMKQAQTLLQESFAGLPPYEGTAVFASHTS